MSKTSALSATGLLAASALLLTACASEPTLEESWPETRRQIVDAQSLRLTMEGEATEAEGSDDASASASPGSEIESAQMDLAGAVDDSHLKGTVQMDMGGTSVDMEILRLQDEVFLKMAAEGDEAPPEMQMLSQIVGDRWMLMPADEASDMGGLSLSSIMNDLEDDLPAEDAFDGDDIKAEKVDLDGTEYLKYTLPEEEKDFAGVIYVNPEDKRLHRAEDLNTEDSEVDATATFTEWDAVQAPERPADDDVFDMAALQNAMGG